MTRILAALAFFGLLLLPSHANVPPPEPDPLPPPNATMRELYMDYFEQFAAYMKEGQNAPYPNGDALAAKYFEPALALRYAKATADDDGELGEGDIDFDVFINAQDAGEFVLKDVRTVSQDGPKAVVDVEFANSGVPQIIRYDLVAIDGAWKIADIHWGEEGAHLVGLLEPAAQ